MWLVLFMKTCFGYNGVVLFERKGVDSWSFHKFNSAEAKFEVKVV